MDSRVALGWPELDRRLDEIISLIRQIAPPETNGDRVWFSSESAAHFLDTSVPALRAAVRAGRLTAHRDPGGRLRFHVDDLNSYARSGDDALAPQDGGGGRPASAVVSSTSRERRSS